MGKESLFDWGDVALCGMDLSLVSPPSDPQRQSGGVCLTKTLKVLPQRRGPAGWVARSLVRLVAGRGEGRAVWRPAWMGAVLRSWLLA